MDAYRRHGAGSSLPKFYGLLADRLGEDRQYDAALRYLDQAQAHIERTDERANEAETWRLRGKLLFARNPDDLASAEACVRRAIDIAREQEAKAWELRAATTLASILRFHGRRQEARQCLAPVYGWFREGLDTPDLRDARLAAARAVMNATWPPRPGVAVLAPRPPINRTANHPLSRLHA